MRYIGRALVASAFVLGACAGGDNAEQGSTDTTTAAAPAATTPSATGTPAAAPATGTTHEVRMVLEGSAYKFVPADITIKQGDAIRWTMVSGAPHNVAFDPAKVPDDVEAQLSANMPNQQAPLSGPFLMDPNSTYTISFAGITPGKYDYICTPHLALGMVGTITIQ
ncbi:MAG: plastocyanin/azurin family copper-binding protein [Gemmatimonadaceae bacterium]